MAIKGIEFIYIFIGALIGLIFASPVQDLVNVVLDVNTSSGIANNTGIEYTIYGYIPLMYALCMLGLMVGSLAMFFRGRR